MDVSPVSSADSVNQILQMAQQKTMDLDKKMIQVNAEMSIEAGKGRLLDTVA